VTSSGGTPAGVPEPEDGHDAPSDRLDPARRGYWCPCQTYASAMPMTPMYGCELS
jgi:hypothetical protein